jgi:hypothetical protein
MKSLLKIKQTRVLVHNTIIPDVLPSPILALQPLCVYLSNKQTFHMIKLNTAWMCGTPGSQQKKMKIFLILQNYSQMLIKERRRLDFRMICPNASRIGILSLSAKEKNFSFSMKKKYKKMKSKIKQNQK